MSGLAFGFSSTRYGVRLGSMSPTDAGNTAVGYALGVCPNWGQGPSPYYDNMSYDTSVGSPPGVGNGGQFPGWTAIPYLRPSGVTMFDAGYAAKMQSPQDILLSRAQAADVSQSHAQSALFGIGESGAVGSTVAPNQYGLQITQAMLDVSAECMLAGIDRNAYRNSLISGDRTPLGSQAITGTTGDTISPIVYTTGGAHLLVTGDRVTVSGVLGNLAANKTGYVTVLSSTTFNIAGVGTGAYSGGGTVALLPPLVAGPGGTGGSGTLPTAATYSIIPVYSPGPWLSAADLFSNPAIYAYVGVRDDADSLIGVSAYVNCALSRISWSFGVGAGLTRSLQLTCPWNVDFDAGAINAWYNMDGSSGSNGTGRFRLTTPGMQVGNTRYTADIPKEYAYAQSNGGEFMPLYDPNGSGVRVYYPSSSAAGKPGTPMLYNEPSVGVNGQPGGWGFLAPNSLTILGGPTTGQGQPVYTPALTVGRDCFLDIAYYSQSAGQWKWASASGYLKQATVAGAVGQGMAAFSETANWPGGISRVQTFSISGASRSSYTEELGNRAMVGIVVEPPEVSGTFSLVEVDAVGLESILYQPVNPFIMYDTPGAPGVNPTLSGPGVTLGGASVNAAGNTYGGAQSLLFDPNSPMRVNLVLTVASPTSSRVAMLRYVVPNVRVTNKSKRIRVGGVTVRQYGFVCEDGNVASAATIDGTAGFGLAGNVGLNTGAPPDGYGLKIGPGGQTGGFVVQSFYIPGI